MAPFGEGDNRGDLAHRLPTRTDEVIPARMSSVREGRSACRSLEHPDALTELSDPVPAGFMGPQVLAACYGKGEKDGIQPEGTQLPQGSRFHP